MGRHFKQTVTGGVDPSAGGASQGAAPRAVLVIFVAVCACLCLVPFVGMAWAPTTTTTENRELAEVPVLLEDNGTLNSAYLSDWGTYFEDHFAYRNELVTLNAQLRATLFGVSATDSVVVGTDGWLYYGGTLSDYCGYALLSERGIDNIAFNLSLMEGYVEANGAEFIVTFAPNKNSLYSENMPYYYVEGEERNLASLEEALSSYGVGYLSLMDVFSDEDEVLYYLRDTHWNTKGALLATQSLLDALGETDEASALEGLEVVEVDDYVGDLASMLYPTAAEAETDYSYDADLSWEYVEGESVEDSLVVTTGVGDSALYMYRDSFANNMIPFFATAYGTACFTKLVPYDLTQAAAYGADVVIIERAERNLADLGTDPAIMPAPSLALEVSGEAGEAAEGLITVEADGDYLVVSGDLPEEWQTESVDMYIGLEGEDGAITWYVPFHTTTDEGDYGYKAYFTSGTWDGVQVVWLACADGSGGDAATSVGYVSIDE